MSRPIDSTMRLSRQFLNLIVFNRTNGFKSLRFLDLKRQQLFTTPRPSTASTGGDGFESARPPRTKSLVFEKLRLPPASYQFGSRNPQGWGLHINCLPLSDRRVFCTDQGGHNFVFDGMARHVATMPSLQIPRVRPISIFIPSTDVIGGGSLFLVDASPSMTRASATVEFESLVYRKASFCNTYFWQGQLLPPPPYAHGCCSQISSYAVVGGGSHICISVKDEGTYCLDTTTHTWSQVGKWTLPFGGKVEYVPELKLWFGLSADYQKLAVADLSFLSNAVDSSAAMSHPPALLGSWVELTLPEEFKQHGKAQLVNLGSGRFCISRFLHYTYDEDEWDTECVVLTGVEMVPHIDSKGKLKFQMIPHKSRLHMPSSAQATIDEVF